mmetsp:Transcript_40061/g.80347  ORF Transcript_40061/g.80347 Transcript_40061/m.80347 type:complete len:229 (+) Transcript_40061:273-959(+)
MRASCPSPGALLWLTVNSKRLLDSLSCEDIRGVSNVLVDVGKRSLQHSLSLALHHRLMVCDVLVNERIRLTKHLVGGHRSHGMIHVPVVRLIGEHAFEAVDPHRIGWQQPVFDGSFGGGYVLPCLMQLRTRCLGHRDYVGVSVHGRLLEVTHETVEQLRFDHVECGKKGRHSHLAGLHDKASDRPRLEKTHAHDEMHPLILRLFEQCEDEAVITLKLPQRAKVTEHAA